ncbi:MAG TPA: tRNA (adenosine(37)-N6)-dimethylallyltransferase MiaA [Actinomycetales bacterium]|nr:tRNA (adenosine(37)-N6)-dimethylallyltransferase MiaA [Actinomycetales bacterium]
MPEPVVPFVLAVVGPTATGKSDLAVRLALELDGDVVNADASQLYRGMDIGTAKLPVDERRGVPHHLLDVLDVREEASVAAFQRAARETFDDIQAHRRVPVLTGGSGLYIRAALDRLELPGTDPSIRARLENEAAEVGGEAMHDRLRAADPLAAESILPTNTRRIVRALEVVELTGRAFSATMPVHEYVRAAVQIGLAMPREDVDARIEQRVEEMFDAGLVDEVERLAAQGLREGRTASRAVGYAQVLAYLDGACSLDEARADTIRATKKLARRQERWFRRDPRIHWVDAGTQAFDQSLAVLRSLRP